MSHASETWRWGDDPSRLVAALDRGDFLAIPTESSYGLAADPRNAAGVAGVFRFKGRPPDKPLPVVLGDLAQLTMLGGDPGASELAELRTLWPAPLTVIVPIRRPLPATAGAASLAIRIPAHKRLRSLLSELNRPLTATSANPAGREPVSKLVDLHRLLTGWPGIILDDGDLPGGLASTIVQWTKDGLAVLREGAIDRQWLQARVSQPVFSAGTAEISADDPAETP
jgi:L-threonylcarbamoyladenylate synthase